MTQVHVVEIGDCEAVTAQISDMGRKCIVLNGDSDHVILVEFDPDEVSKPNPVPVEEPKTGEE